MQTMEKGNIRIRQSEWDDDKVSIEVFDKHNADYSVVISLDKSDFGDLFDVVNAFYFRNIR